ncbi:MAG: acetylornithine aminotransferase [Bacteroidia bacterium]|nr:MAG: acetylornithine aminotransferase [Bacteroidia bacterium]
MPTLFEQEQSLFFQTYKRLPLDIVRGQGCYLTDRQGRQYLDFFGGLAVNALGYCHPRVVKAIKDQADQYIHLSNFFVQEPQVKLAERLLALSGFARIFFTNSGTEAIEGAIKLVRKWGTPRGKKNLFGLSNSFHGRTMGALSLTERAKYREGYEPFLPHTGHIRFNDVEDLRAKVNDETLAVFVEPIQGEGGINVLSREFCTELSTLRTKHGFLLVADEIQSGMGRTGKLFGYQHLGLLPEVVVVAKAIGGGLPLGAILGSSAVASVFTYGVHGTTFGGNPVACAAGLAVMEEIIDGGLMTRAGAIGERLLAGFQELRRRYPAIVTEVRGFGCMLGVQLSVEGQSVVDRLMERGILVNCTNTNVLRFLPPYIATDEECKRVVNELGEVLGSL